MRVECDVLIFGGGVAGLWTLDALVERGVSALLLEAGELGGGQTIGSQGILHGGLKYTLQGLLTPSASSIREMPGVWRECLAGARRPDLRGVRLRSPCCYLWRTDSFASRMGMIGARLGLRVTPQSVARSERPAALRHSPGDVARLDEQVLSPASLLEALAGRHAARMLQIDADRGLRFVSSGPGFVTAVHLRRPGADDELTIRPRHVVLTAGAGNADLRRRAGLPASAMQRRPLHMALVRGELPVLNGHCVDGAKTRVTITTDTDAEGRVVWQVGGQIAEEGVELDRTRLVEMCRSELEAVLPGLDLSQAEFAAYRVDRAEGATAGGRRPESFQVLEDGNVVTAWPTKLVLAPQLAEALADRLAASIPGLRGASIPEMGDWPRPRVAAAPWDTCGEWIAAAERGRRAA